MKSASAKFMVYKSNWPKMHLHRKRAGDVAAFHKNQQCLDFAAVFRFKFRESVVIFLLLLAAVFLAFKKVSQQCYGIFCSIS